ncbi:MAG: GNAT family N-acetyltransferase [Eubacteriales bacterium]|nr:GNAT family N-acetyltransferase [Eubacteriales bacterium]
MEEQLSLISAKGSILEEVKRLYLEAFPAEERKPFHVIEELCEKGRMELLAIMEGERFIGLDINMLAPGTDLRLLDYFAIAPSVRGGGYGSRALKCICERFSGHQFIFEIEPQDEAAENAEQRSRRKAFYLRNGLLESGLYVSLFHVPFELLSTKPGLRYQDYTDALAATFGKVYFEMAEPKLLKQENL